MLIIVEDRDIAALLEAAFDFETAGGRNILQVYAAETARKQLHSPDDIVHLLGAHAQGDSVHISEGFEQGTLLSLIHI